MSAARLCCCFVVLLLLLRWVGMNCQPRVSSSTAAMATLQAEAAAATKKGGLLSSFVRTLGVNVVGTQALTRSDIEPALATLKKKLMERNVAEEIADK